MSDFSPAEKKLHNNVLIMYKIVYSEMSNWEGFRRLPPMGVGHVFPMPRHIANLRNEAVKRHNEV